MDTYVPSGPGRHRANERLKARWRVVFWSSTLAAVVAHTLAFALWPPIEVQLGHGAVRATELMPQLIPPEVLMPRDPIALLAERLIAPAMPVLSAESEVAPEEVTLPIFQFDDVRAIDLPAPPVTPADDNVKQLRAFVPSVVQPELLNRAEMARQVSWQYERRLSFVRATGQTVMRIWLDRAGKVQKHEIMASSGDRVLDRIAERAVALMRFSPAVHLGQTTDMVVTIPVSFQTMVGHVP